MSGLVIVGAGGIAGAVTRFLVGEQLEGDRVDTLVVNVVGSFVLGAVLGVPSGGATTPLTLAVGTGFCGAFTTFSTFAVETVDLIEADGAVSGIRYGGGTLVLALGAMVIGRFLVVGIG
jgi:CrcB protein